jgi:hypothetical protein
MYWQGLLEVLGNCSELLVGLAPRFVISCFSLFCCSFVISKCCCWSCCLASSNCISFILDCNLDTAAFSTDSVSLRYWASFSSNVSRLALCLLLLVAAPLLLLLLLLLLFFCLFPFDDLLLMWRANSNGRRHSICINPS